MAAWRFIESDADGKVWLDSPDKTWAFVEADGVRLAVVTTSWMQAVLDGMRAPESFSVLPATLVVADGSADERKEAIGRAAELGAFKHFGRSV